MFPCQLVQFQACYFFCAPDFQPIFLLLFTLVAFDCILQTRCGFFFSLSKSSLEARKISNICPPFCSAFGAYGSKRIAEYILTSILCTRLILTEYAHIWRIPNTNYWLNKMHREFFSSSSASSSFFEKNTNPLFCRCCHRKML